MNDVFNVIQHSGNGTDSRKAADQKFCFSCSAVLHSSATGCPKCGAVQPVVQAVVHTTYQYPVPPSTRQQLPNHVFCRGCSASLHETATTCPKCGAQQITDSEFVGNGSNRVVAAVLAFFLGWIGAHKFYLGQIGLGILYLLFFWTAIPAFVSIIEGIIYLTMSDNEFSRKY